MSFKRVKPLLFILLIIIFIKFEGSSVFHFCLFEQILNIHCPFCGLTKSFEEILNQNFLNAFEINFLSYGLIFFFLLKAIFEAFKLEAQILNLNKIFTFLVFVQFLKSNLILGAI